METRSLISLHGGHSGEFCCHARDRLEEIIRAYIEKGFKIVGITEHMPPPSDRFLYPDERQKGMTAITLYQQFARYMTEVRRLKSLYQSDILIYAGMETETYAGYLPHVKQLIHDFKPDYIVGSVHHVDDRCFDYSRQAYDKIVLHCGSHEQMYLRYFDLQYEMIRELHPFVVGHFDLIRIHDENFGQRLLSPKIHGKILRNLHLIKDLGLVMDFNLRPLARGEKEPYLFRPLLETIKELGIPVVPGDDSHGKDQAGGHVPGAIRILESLGFDTHWPEPRMIRPDLKKNAKDME
ncbi:MAG: histidinol-phosphatase [Proteobacteria bacterium]|nr:histidinol-phosphatase [Desulfobacula sp.]MBU3951358.1 histidinol-phosphatase [Pseudomonadota bacterium]MBU4133000.1 histidinol-phosphatase [Pseudomonadota bacterium]